jgi:hypothetical protein
MPRQDMPQSDRGSNVSGPSYMQTPQSDMSDLPATSMSDHNYYDSSRTYYSSPSSNSRTDYRSSYSGESSASQYTPTTTTAGYGPVDAGYYQGGQASYISPPTTHGDYYSSSSQAGGDWLSANGDPGAFVGAGSTDYYYAYDPDVDDSGPLSYRY